MDDIFRRPRHSPLALYPPPCPDMHTFREAAESLVKHGGSALYLPKVVAYLGDRSVTSICPFDLYEMAKALSEEQGGACYLCGVKLSYGGLDPLREMTFEHLRPLSRGGTSQRGNLVASCMACNRRKGNMLEDEYYRYLVALDESEDESAQKSHLHP